MTSNDEKGVEGCACLCSPIIPTTQDAEAGQLQLQDLPWLYLLWLQSEFTASLGNLVRPCSKATLFLRQGSGYVVPTVLELTYVDHTSLRLAEILPLHVPPKH